MFFSGTSESVPTGLAAATRLSRTDIRSLAIMPGGPNDCCLVFRDRGPYDRAAYEEPRKVDEKRESRGRNVGKQEHMIARFISILLQYAAAVLSSVQRQARRLLELTLRHRCGLTGRVTRDGHDVERL